MVSWSLIYTCAISCCLSFFRLLPVVRSAPAEIPSAASFYVPTLPGLHEDDTHPLHIYAGHIPSDPNASSYTNKDTLSHLFFVLVKARRASDKERVMFWFNGGPGCSSFDGLMMEVGPWRVDGQGGLRTKEGGWEEYTTMVFVDQPAGTGFSYTGTNHYVHTLEEASRQILEFLRTFYQVFPEYQAIDTYLGGESYAGQYIPYFANAILSSNMGIPLRGIAIGNGWIDGRNQYPAYLEYAVKHGIVEENSMHYNEAKKHTDQCMEELRRFTTMEPIKVSSCENLVSFVPASRDKYVDGQQKCMNVYDVRLDDDMPYCGMQWPPDLKDINTYLSRKDVINSLHASAKSESWVECRGRIGQELHENLSPSAVTLLPKILEQIPVLLFAGDQDFICNYMGIEATIRALNWNGEIGLGTVQTQTWTVQDVPAGTWVSSRNLTYAKIFNASHMVPYDLPFVAHDMILRFMGMNFSAIADGSARIPSSVGDDIKPILGDTEYIPDMSAPSTTPEQDKAMWEAYYNAGSTALILVILAIVIGLFLWCRIRRRRHLVLSNKEAMGEEHIPLTNTVNGDDYDPEAYRKRKGKQREENTESESTPIFDVGDDDEDYKSEDDRKQ